MAQKSLPHYFSTHNLDMLLVCQASGRDRIIVPAHVSWLLRKAHCGVVETPKIILEQ